jgi:hypothetical protein
MTVAKGDDADALSPVPLPLILAAYAGNCLTSAVHGTGHRVWEALYGLTSPT